MATLAHLNKVRVVMVNTSHPGNIGSAARAMKTMGLSQLCLVAPLIFPHAQATELAAKADDILAAARVVDNFDQALAGCSLVLGTSARLRALPWPLLTPPLAARKILEMSAAADGDVALVFGNEQYGLTNAQLQRCQYHIHIPVNPDYQSLNVAQAVQVLCYEIRMAFLAATATTHCTAIDNPATHEELTRFFTHLEETLIELQVLDPKTPRQLMPRLKRLFVRCELEQEEVNLLRGILSAAQRQRRGL